MDIKSVIVIIETVKKLLLYRFLFWFCDQISYRNYRNSEKTIVVYRFLFPFYDVKKSCVLFLL